MKKRKAEDLGENENSESSKRSGNGSHASESKNELIDLRSDTVTKPTPEMRKAMAEAAVGDDVMGEDPTVIQLQEQMAKLLGKEAGLFVPTGTMGNLISVMVHCERRDSEMIVGSLAHIHLYEQGGSATLGGIHSRVVENSDDGTMPLDKIEEKIRAKLDDHFPITRLICLENTHNRCGGRVLKAEYIDSVGALCQKYNLKLHIDGARLMHASIALDVPPSRLVRAADSVSVCLSKGLASPVGSVIVGTKEFIAAAKRLRKVLGGGMRQSGVLAACGLVSLNKMVDRLAVDHQHAKILGEGLSKISGLRVEENKIESNIVFIHIDQPLSNKYDAAAVVSQIKGKGVLCSPVAPMLIRLVVHYHITKKDVEYVIEQFVSVCDTFRQNIK